MRRNTILSAAGFLLCANFAWADPGIYEANYSITLRKSTPALVAAMVMGAEGYSRYTPSSGWQTDLLTQCKNETKRYRPSPDPTLSAWPNQCDPQGMAEALSKDPKMVGAWSVRTFGSLQLMDAIYEILIALSIGSPAVVPMRGNPAHWVTVRKLELVYERTTPSVPKTWIYDALVGFGTFSTSGEYELYGREALSRVMEPLWTAAGDLYHDRFVVAHDPPKPTRGPVPILVSPAAEETARRAAIRPEWGAGTSVSVEEAILRSLRDAVESADAVGGPLLRWALSLGVPDRPLLVHGVAREGAERDYFLVPIRSMESRESIVALAEVDAKSGLPQSVFRPEGPITYAPISELQAAAAARSLLQRGELLASPRLTWNVWQRALSLDAPVLPFYEAEIHDQAGRTTGYALVALHDAQYLARLPSNYRR
jgi:hypothetical protein